METVSLLNLGFFAKLATIVDIIPKIIYLLYACLASAVDALQALVRKLAGLDVYYQAATDEAVAGVDPLTEFVYGILGFGNSAPLYEALNTVFWSFAIFGLIILAVSTMAAIIKSHYKEDSQGTSPWKYIYTAGKAIFTFAVVPVLVIIGLQLSSFVLRTLDNITAGSGSEEEMLAMFGRSAVDRFKSDTVEGTEEYDKNGNRIEGTGTITYAYYDFFGNGAPSTTTTFSGMLFKAAAYSCNRARTDSYTVTHLQSFFGGGILGNRESEFPDSGTDDEKLEYIADQLDYLFANNVHFASDYSYWQVVSESNDVAPVWSVTDITGIGKVVVGSFSKYDVSFIWIFYNLWTFNFLTGFVGVFVTFGIMISIILGMMSRLIKGAALFLIYPALLGIAPLDDFKAFKGWGTQFMQQLMMAFGSILGINLLLLVLPYVQNINFFNIAVVDVIIQLIMLVAGLLMAKDFITMINGFVGGADASQAGEGAKGSIGGKLKAGIRPAANIAGAGVRVARKGVQAVGRVGLAAGKSIAIKSSAWRANRQAKKAANLQKKMEEGKGILGKNHKKYQDELKKKGLGENAKEIEYQGRKTGIMGNAAAEEAYKKAYDKKKEKALAHGWTEEAADEMAHKAGEKAAKFSIRGDKAKALEQGGILAKIAEAKLQHHKDTEKNIKEKYKLSGESQAYQKSTDTLKMKSENMSNLGKGIKGDMAEAGKSLADGFLKAVKGVGNVMGIDKAVAGAKDVLGESLSSKGGYFEERKNKREEKKKEDEAKEKEKTAAANSDAQTTALKSLVEQSGKQADALTAFASNLEGLLKETKDSAAASRATADAVKALGDKLKPSGGGSSSSSGGSGDSSGS